MHLKSVIKPGMRAVFYGRHSTNKQTMDAQRNTVKDFMDKYECQFVGEYLDPAVSARKTKLKERNGISQLLADAHMDKYDLVVISQHDRIARNPSEHQMIRMTLKNYNIPVCIASTESLYDSGDLVVDIIKDGNSKLEVDNTRIRTKDTMYNLFKQAKWRGGKPPFGYKYNKATKAIETVDHELQLVKDVYSMYLQFEGFDAIACKLPKGSYLGSDWTDQAVRAVVTNPFYAGYLHRGRKKQQANNSLNARADWELVQSKLIHPVITIEEWERGWDLYQKRAEGTHAPNRYKTSFLLADLLVCDSCNDKLRGKDQTTRSKSGARYGKKVYLCTNCGYKIDIQKTHRIIDHLLNDLKFRHEEMIVDKIIQSLELDLMNLHANIQVLQASKQTVQHKLNKVNHEINEQFKCVQNPGDKDEQQKRAEMMIRILTMTKENCLKQIKSFDEQITQKQLQMNRIRAADLKADHIRSRVDQLMDSHTQGKLLRGLLLEFVHQIRIDKTGRVKISARYALLETEI
ncbi:recombinase family protein [Paenibacillus tengchongensis]|uniref:recombinase family protein n=1 Tax=Paenibacillus tengchongensis TaxID=2608684 RepID=UPI0016527D6B|nr:recombinase family protein [Paenibacillus tengchongensis]